MARLRPTPPDILRKARPAAWMLVTVTVATVSWLWYQDAFTLSHLRDEVMGAGVWAPLAFIAACIILIPCLIPKTPLVLLAGLLFGPWVGTPVALLGQTLGGLVAYYLGGLLGLGSMTTFGSGRLSRLMTWARDHATLGVAVLQATPFLPTNMLNYGYKGSGFNRRQYTAGTLIGLFPSTFLLTATGDALLKARFWSDLGQPEIWVPIVGLGLIVATGIWLRRRVRAIAQAASVQPP